MPGLETGCVRPRPARHVAVGFSAQHVGTANYKEKRKRQPQAGNRIYEEGKFTHAHKDSAPTAVSAIFKPRHSPGLKTFARVTQRHMSDVRASGDLRMSYALRILRPHCTTRPTPPTPVYRTARPHPPAHPCLPSGIRRSHGHALFPKWRFTDEQQQENRKQKDLFRL